MALDRFDPPGFLDDLDKNGRRLWSDWVSSQIDQASNVTDKDSGLANYGPRPQFFNPLRVALADDVKEQDVIWTAFPRIVKLQSPGDLQRWKKADASRDRQDEYCEWSVTRDPATGKITRVTFTTEGPEYWRFLAEADPEKVLVLYKQHVSVAVQRGDLFMGGRYEPRNKWNANTSDGAMHLVQANNTLSAEIELAAAATIVRQSQGRTLTGEQELIWCGRYGQPERNSDPHIGSAVNGLARLGASVALANPVGLCIAGLSTAGWSTPDGSDPASYWTITRGTLAKALRAVYEVPVNRGFMVGDIRINGRRIDFGSQIADFLTIKLTGLAMRFGGSAVEPTECVPKAPEFLAELAATTTGIAAWRPTRLQIEGDADQFFREEPPLIKQLDPALRRLVRMARPAHVQEYAMAGAGGEYIPSAAPEKPETKRVLVEFRTPEVPKDAQEIAGQWQQIVPGIFTVDCPIDRLEALAQHPALVYIEGGRPFAPTLDTSVPETKANLLHRGLGNIGPLTGKGVVIGIIDSGFDFTLDDFREANGDTRIAYLWDQKLKRLQGEHFPPNMLLGVEYSQVDINRALKAPNPFSVVRHLPDGRAHGTHVMGIAAGNGASWDAQYPAGKYIGVAPEATLILVQLGGDSGGETLSDSPFVAQAITYIFNRAKDLGMPCVINMSLAQNLGSHDGESVVERAIDKALEEDRGRAFVVPAGNEHEWRTHASGLLKPGETRQLHWRFGGGFPGKSAPAPGARDDTPNTMEIWYSSRDVFTVQITDPAGNSTRAVSIDEHEVFTLGGNRVDIQSERFTALNGEARIYIYVERDQSLLQSGVWIVELEGAEVRNGRFDAWIERDVRSRLGAPDQSFFDDPDFDPSQTVSTPGTARSVVSVANYDHAKQVVSPSSGRGRTRDGRDKPDVSAPGTAIVSSCARGGSLDSQGNTVPMRVVQTGTSMASPHVAGVIALLLQNEKTLTGFQLQKILVASASKPNGSTNFEEGWGYGRVDAAEALRLIT